MSVEEPSLVERLMAEQPIGMAAAARRFGEYRAGRPVHPSTLTRWATDGVTLDDGGTLRLETFRLNGRLMTSVPALIRFVESQQADPRPADEGPPRSPTARQRAADRAGRELEMMGC